MRLPASLRYAIPRLRHRVRMLWGNRWGLGAEILATVIVGLLAALIVLLPIALGLGAAWLFNHHFR